MQDFNSPEPESEDMFSPRPARLREGVSPGKDKIKFGWHVEVCCIYHLAVRISARKTSSKAWRKELEENC